MRSLGKKLTGVTVNFLLMMLIAPSCFSDELSDAFETTAALDGDEYAAAQAELLKSGQALRPVLDQKLNSKNWREKFLARVLSLELENQELAADLRHLARSWNYEFKFVDDKPVVHIPPYYQEDAKEAGIEFDEDGMFPLGPEAIPILVDQIRVTQNNDSVAAIVYKNSASVFQHYKAAETAPVLLHFASRWEEQVAHTAEVLVSFGPDINPILHRILRQPEFFPPGEPNKKPDTWTMPQINRANLAARVLGETGDEFSARMLIKYRLNETDGKAFCSEAICEAISKLQPDTCAPVIFEYLVSGRLLVRDGYNDVRRVFINLGERAESELEKRLDEDSNPRIRAIANGIRFEMNNAEHCKTLYLALGRPGHENERRRPQGGGSELDDELAENESVYIRRGRTMLEPYAVRQLDLDIEILGELLIELAAYRPDRDYLESLKILKKPNDIGFRFLSHINVNDEAATQVGWDSAIRFHSIVPIAISGGTDSVDVLCEMIERYNGLDYWQLLKAVVAINDPAAVKILDAMRSPDFSPTGIAGTWADEQSHLAATAACFKEDEPLVAMLSLESPRYRQLAALELARKLDVRCLPVLFQGLLNISSTNFQIDSPYVGRGSGGGQPGELSSASFSGRISFWICNLDPSCVDSIKRLADESDSPLADVLAEAWILQLTNPELYQQYKKARFMPVPSQFNRAGPDEEDFQVGGEEFANAVGEDAVPFLEADMIWPDRYVDRHKTYYALGHLGPQRWRAIIEWSKNNR